MDQGFELPLRMIGKKHDAVAVVVHDPAEIEIPQLGLVDLHDAETGEILTVDTSSPSFRKLFLEQTKARMERQEAEIKKAQVDRIDIRTDQDFVIPLVGFFKKRSRR